MADIQAKVRDHNRKREEMIAFLAKIEFVILEEAHEASGNGFCEEMRHQCGTDTTLPDHQNERISIIKNTRSFAKNVVADLDYPVFRKAA